MLAVSWADMWADWMVARRDDLMADERVEWKVDQWAVMLE